MKIISRIKDYFHYLQGVIGIDDKVVLEYTTTYSYLYKPTPYTTIQLWICGWLIEGIYINGEYRYGVELEEYNKEIKYLNTKDYYNIPYGRFHYNVLKIPTYFKENPNEFHNCPLIVIYKSLYGENKWKEKVINEFPILKEYNFYKVWDAYKVWNIIYDFLSRDVIVVDNRTNKEKIVNNGFDLKESFRNIK